MARSNPVNPDILLWARETAGISLEEAARRLKRKTITARTIAAWERGELSPTYAQLETLAYEIYKRPLALFFFPGPPEEKTPRQSFRTLPEPQLARLSPGLRFLIRKAQSMRINLEELYEGVNPAPRLITKDIGFTTEIKLAEMVVALRRYLKVDLVEQCSWPNPDHAFKNWREVLQDCGVFVFKEAFKEETCSGFCLYDDRFPLIYVNNSKSQTRQIFTLFHELSHLLFGVGGVDTPLEDDIDLLKGTDRNIEILCNRFAGSFLVPDDDFDQRIFRSVINDETIKALADHYCVSREVVLRKLFDRNLMTSRDYDRKVEQWRKETKGRSGGGGDYYLNKRAYLGQRYLEQAFGRFYQGRISKGQLADYLGVKANNVAGLETLLLQKRSAL